MEVARLPTEEEIRNATRQAEDANVAFVSNLVSSWIGLLYQQQEQLQEQLEKAQVQQRQAAFQ
jgi:hypothetical protein